MHQAAFNPADLGLEGRQQALLVHRHVAGGVAGHRQLVLQWCVHVQLRVQAGQDRGIGDDRLRLHGACGNGRNDQAPTHVAHRMYRLRRA